MRRCGSHSASMIEYGVTVSVGIATMTDPKTRAEDLLRRADLAMYRAKDNGRNRVEYYAEELEARAVAHVEATETLRRAISDDLILVHYQPIVDMKDGGSWGSRPSPGSKPTMVRSCTLRPSSVLPRRRDW